jgi:hypothetical protein
MQYYNNGWFGIVFTLVLVGFVLYNIYRAKQSKEALYIRRIAGLNAIDEAIGRATEMGRPVLMVPGIGGLTAPSLQALNIFAHVTSIAAKFATPIRLCCGNAAVYTVAQETISEVYQREGLSERFDQNSVQFVSDRQFAFATGVSGIIHREKVAAAFLLGEFYAEALIFAETANSIGAIQVASSTQNTQTPFFIAACDYVLIADEFYAASAYLTREPVLTGSLVGQDWMKLSLIGFVLLGSITTSIEKPFIKQTTEEKDGEQVTIPARTKQGPELLFTPYFEIKPVEDKDKPKRELWPVDPAKAAADAAEGESK